MQEVTRTLHQHLYKKVLDIEDPTGGIFMKIKLFVGFAQCLSYFPVIFDTIPWPSDLLALMSFMEIFSFDIVTIFGAVSCHLQTDFISKFTFHMALVPVSTTYRCYRSLFKTPATYVECI